MATLLLGMVRKRRRSSTGLGASAPGLFGKLSGLHTLPEAGYFFCQNELTPLEVVGHKLFVPAIAVSCGPGKSHFRQPERELHPASVCFVQTVVHYYHSNPSHLQMLW